ncbi:MAG: hypothetical protein ACXWZF_08820 [Actinomycetota bacterium]
MFLLDELLLFGAAVITMRATKIQERHGRELKLVSGVVMLTLAGVLVVRPSLLETVTGALAVLPATVFIVALAIAVRRWGDVRRSHAVAGR